MNIGLSPYYTVIGGLVIDMVVRCLMAPLLIESMPYLLYPIFVWPQGVSKFDKNAFSIQSDIKAVIKKIIIFT